jgi:hypothetical protein
MITMQSTLSPHARKLVGLAAAAGAFGVAAMMSAATAPTARADDFSSIIAAVDGDFAFGQAALTTAYSDLASNELVPGLTSFFDGVNDDTLSAPNTLLIGTVEALTNEPILTGTSNWEFLAPTSFADALSDAQGYFASAQTYFADAVTAFTSGDYGTAAYYDLYGMDLSSIAPLEILLIGSAAAL